MLVHDSRILKVTLFGRLQRNLSALDFSLVVPDVMTIADEVDSQLRQALESFTKVAGTAAAAQPKVQKERSFYVSLSDLRSMKGPHTIWGPLKRRLPIDGKGPGRLGYVTGVVSIRRWIGEGILFIISGHPHQIVAQPDPLAAPWTGTGKTTERAASGRVSSSSILQSQESTITVP
jgi:hypothetical protein